MNLTENLWNALNDLLSRSTPENGGWVAYGRGYRQFRTKARTVDSLLRRGFVETRMHTFTGIKEAKLTDAGLHAIGLARAIEGSR